MEQNTAEELLQQLKDKHFGELEEEEVQEAPLQQPLPTTPDGDNDDDEASHGVVHNNQGQGGSSNRKAKEEAIEKMNEVRMLEWMDKSDQSGPEDNHDDADGDHDMNRSALGKNAEGVAMAPKSNPSGEGGLTDKALLILDEIQGIISKAISGMEEAPGLSKAKDLVQVVQGALASTATTTTTATAATTTATTLNGNTTMSPLPPPPQHWYRAQRQFRRSINSWKQENIMNGILNADRMTALTQEDEKPMRKKEALTILLECQQWALEHAPELMGVVEAVKALTGNLDILAGGKAMYIPNWICYLAKAVNYMMREQKQLEEDDVLLPASVVAEVAIKPIRRRMNSGIYNTNMSAVFWTSTIKSNYHSTWIQSLQKEGKTPSSHLKEKMTKLEKNYDISLETLMERLRKMHIGMKSSLNENEKEVVLIDLENEEDHTSVLDKNTESHIRHFAWANDLNADRQVNLFTRAKKQKALSNNNNHDHNHNNINSNSTP